MSLGRKDISAVFHTIDYVIIIKRISFIVENLEAELQICSMALILVVFGGPQRHVTGDDESFGPSRRAEKARQDTNKYFAYYYYLLF